MKSRRDRILDVAISLAEEGGFENVRQRDVAEKAGVALGTLYKVFRTKEDLLSAALAREAETLEKRMEGQPIKGKTPVDRVAGFFRVLTSGMCRKPRLTRAVVRAMASGEAEVADNVVAYYGRMNRLLLSALRGDRLISEEELGEAPASDKETTLTLLLLQLWFAELVAWSAGLLSQKQVIDHVHVAAEVIVRGLEGHEDTRIELGPRRRRPRTK